MSNDTAAIKVRGNEWADLVSDVDEAIEISLLSGRPDTAMELGREIIRKGRLSGVKLARLLYEIDEAWHLFRTDDRVEDAIERDIGIPKETFIKYSRMYRFVLRDRPTLAGKPIEGLIKLTAGAREGDFSDDDWKEIVLAPNVRAMLVVRDRARGIQTSGHSKLALWCTPNGQLELKRGSNGKQKNWGFVPANSPDKDISAAVARLESIGVIFQ